MIGKDRILPGIDPACLVSCQNIIINRLIGFAALLIMEGQLRGDTIEPFTVDIFQAVGDLLMEVISARRAQPILDDFPEFFVAEVISFCTLFPDHPALPEFIQGLQYNFFIHLPGPGKKFKVEIPSYHRRQTAKLPGLRC